MRLITLCALRDLDFEVYRSPGGRITNALQPFLQQAGLLLAFIFSSRREIGQPGFRLVSRRIRVQVGLGRCVLPAWVTRLDVDERHLNLNCLRAELLT